VRPQLSDTIRRMKRRLLSLLGLFASRFAHKPRRKLCGSITFTHGDAKQEVFSFDRVVIEPLPWPGEPNKESMTPISENISSRCAIRKRKECCTHADSPQSTASGKPPTKPRKLAKFQRVVSFSGAGRGGRDLSEEARCEKRWVEIWKLSLDPKDIFIDRSKSRAPAQLIPIQKMGDRRRRLICFCWAMDTLRVKSESSRRTRAA
jgi:hypothetical protein